MNDAVRKTLNFDDYVFRVYQRGDTVVGVYIAYWGAGRMPLQKVASHTPDRCWTENGWTCPEQRFNVALQNEGVALKPAQWRLFVPPGGAGGSKEYVLYWHLVGDGVYDYGDRFNNRPDAYKWWRDTVRYAFTGSAEQYFVRLSCNRPFEDVWNDPGFERVLASVAAVGVAR